MSIAVAIALGCSGVGVEAPRTIAPDEDTGACPSGDDVLVSLRSQLADGAFDPLRPHIEQILVDDRGVATLLTLVARVLPELDEESMPALLAAVQDDKARSTLSSLKPTLVSVLRYLDGSNDALPGPHDEVVAALRTIVTSCDAPATVQMLRDVLALEVRPGSGGEPRWMRATGEAATASWLFAFLDAADRAAGNATMSALLQGIEITDDEGGDGAIRVGRDAFLVLARLLAANVAAPDFALQPTRDLVDDVLVPRLQGDPDALALLDELLDLMGVLVDPEAATFPGVQAFMGCVDRHDHEAAVPGMLFDFLTTDEIPVTELLDDAVSAAALPQAPALRLAIVALLDAVTRHPAELGDAAGVLGKLLAPEPADALFGVVAGLEGTGVLGELLDLIDALLSCKGVAP